MTIEFSLRRRAKRAQSMAVFWLSLATAILVGTYISLPLIAKRTLGAVNVIAIASSTTTAGRITEGQGNHAELYALGILVLGLLAICFACFLLGRTAFVEIELAARFSAFADALCLSGDNFEQLERTASLLMPGTKYLSVPEIFSTKDVGAVVDAVSKLRPK
jgi:hypothetical protein